MIVRKRGDWLAAQVGDEVLMMSAEHGTYVGLNAVGARIWTLLDEIDDREDLCARLCQEFAVTAEVCAREVTTFLDALAAQGAITSEPHGDRSP
ncbi:PqqD family protein [Sphingomonas sp. PP-CC-3G-468]|uniref:PqqD family protein n=1 Tax=Sphingomonas sp. PP-CC-3G-468 TaxID=2135656 RepID=UPI001045D068|nr:PqqD family protein [Sphingomonas sp. PP-CC-3G-468]TCM07486.1 coenzyme PQQ synthesis protein D (PqqD) [Sphingomonas sp. PP-CC-3G-468]